MNWMILLYIWLGGMLPMFALVWLLDQAYMANKSWGHRATLSDAVGAAVAWPIALVITAFFCCRDSLDALFSERILFKPKQPKTSKCQSRSNGGVA